MQIQALCLLLGAMALATANPTTTERPTSTVNMAGLNHVRRILASEVNDPNSFFHRRVNNEHFGLDENGNPLDGSEIPEDNRPFVEEGNNLNNGNSESSTQAVHGGITHPRNAADGGNDGTQAADTTTTTTTTTTTAAPTTTTTTTTAAPTTTTSRRMIDGGDDGRREKVATADIGDDCGSRRNGVGNRGTGNGLNNGGCNNGNNNVGNDNGSNNGNNNMIQNTPTTEAPTTAAPTTAASVAGQEHRHDEKDFVGYCSTGGRRNFYTIIPHSSCNLYDLRRQRVLTGDVLYATECEDPQHVFDLSTCKCNDKALVDPVTCRSE